MSDLYLAMGISGVVTLGAFLLLRRLMRGVSRSVVLLSLLGAVTLLTLYLQHVDGHVWTARYLPFSNAIILGNATPLLCAIMAAIAWWGIEASTWRRVGVSTVILVVGCVAAWHVAWPRPPQLRDLRSGSIWRQSSNASCSAAAAATLLECYGIPASESEMARLCLTSWRGTRTLGVYRGLRLKTRDTPYRVEPFAGDYEQLLAFATSPVLITVMLKPEDVPGHERYATDWGWIPGTQHTVVVLRRTERGNFIVADPATGVELWPPEALRVLWNGEAFRLVRR